MFATNRSTFQYNGSGTSGWAGGHGWAFVAKNSQNGNWQAAGPTSGIVRVTGVLNLAANNGHSVQAGGRTFFSGVLYQVVLVLTHGRFGPTLSSY